MKEKKLLISALLTIALFVAAYFPVFRILVDKWANSEEYTHAFITIPIIFYMIWSKREELQQLTARYAPLGLCIIFCSTPLYFFALLTQVHTVIALSMYLTVIGAVIYLLGIQAIRVLFTPLLLFLILIPVPEQLYTQLTFPLQLKVSQVSEFLIRTVGVPILREGNVMTIPGKSFEVVEACSGLRSIITLVTLSIIIGYFMLEKTASRAILLITSIPAAVLVNIFRVTSMILLYHFFKIDLVEGLWHTVMGVMVFGIALVIILFTQRLLEHWEATQR